MENHDIILAPQSELFIYEKALSNIVRFIVNYRFVINFRHANE